VLESEAEELENEKEGNLRKENMADIMKIRNARPMGVNRVSISYILILLLTVLFAKV